MTALDELRAKELGDGFLSLLQRTLRAVAVARNFPPPEGHATWTSEAVNDAASDFLSSPQTPRRLSDLALRCRTDSALRGQLQQAVQNHYADGGRRTPVGRLVLRINEVLSDDEEFVRVGRRWTYRGARKGSGDVDQDKLVASLGSVEIVVPTAWTGKRAGPDIDAPSVVRAAEAVIAEVGGPVRTADIARAVARRLGLGAAPLSIEATAYDPPSSASEEPGSGVAVVERADEVLGLLNDHERVAVGIRVPVARLGLMLGVSGSKAALIRNRAISILKDELADEEDGQAVADVVLDRTRVWAESWIIENTPTYESPDA